MAQSQKNSKSPLTYVVEHLFNPNSKEWNDIPYDIKESAFFMINRLLSKQYPQLSNLLNNKSIDSVIALDIWRNKLIKLKKVPYWFWKRPKKEIKDTNDIDNWIEETFYKK